MDTEKQCSDVTRSDEALPEEMLAFITKRWRRFLCPSTNRLLHVLRSQCVSKSPPALTCPPSQRQQGGRKDPGLWTQINVAVNLGSTIIPAN